jgi:hypothetical protein
MCAQSKYGEIPLNLDPEVYHYYNEEKFTSRDVDG